MTFRIFTATSLVSSMALFAMMMINYSSPPGAVMSDVRKFFTNGKAILRSRLFMVFISCALQSLLKLLMLQIMIDDSGL